MNPEQPDRLRRALLALLPMLVITEDSSAQDAVQSQPQNYRVALENDKLRVLEYTSRPGMGVCGDGMHSHPAHLTVLLSTGKVRIKTPDGKVEVHSDSRSARYFGAKRRRTRSRTSAAAISVLSSLSSRALAAEFQ